MITIHKYRSEILIAIMALLLGLPGISLPEEWGVIRYVHTTVNLRLGRSTKTAIVAKLRRGDRVRADFHQNNWYAIFREDEKFREEGNAIGYVYAALLKTDPPPSAKGDKPGLRYRIVEREKLDYGGSPQMTMRVLLDVGAIPTDRTMKQLAEHIWHKGNKGWDEFTVWLYLPGMKIKKSAFGVVVFRKTGLTYFNKSEAALWGTKWE